LETGVSGGLERTRQECTDQAPEQDTLKQKSQENDFDHTVNSNRKWGGKYKMAGNWGMDRGDGGAKQR